MTAGMAFWSVVALVAAALSVPFFTSTLMHFRWRSLPRMSDYLAANPQCRTPRGIKCVVCSSGSIKNRGLAKASDVDRVFVCNHCGTRLYRN